MTETSYIRRLHKKLPKEIYRWKIKDDYAGGVPDAWYSSRKGNLFVEYKYVPSLPKRDTTLIKAALSELQFLWLTERQEEGVNVGVVVGSPDGGVFFENIYDAYDGIPLSQFRERMLDIPMMADYIDWAMMK
jgi:hypothetical protein